MRVAPRAAARLGGKVIAARALRGGMWSSRPNDLTLAAFCVLSSASYLALETYACFWTGQSQVSLARFRTWIARHTDQLIIMGSLILGFWLIGKSIYLIVS